MMFIEGLVQGDDLEQYQQIDKELIRYVNKGYPNTYKNRIICFTYI